MRPCVSHRPTSLIDNVNENGWQIKCAVLFTAQFVAFFAFLLLLWLKLRRGDSLAVDPHLIKSPSPFCLCRSLEQSHFFVHFLSTWIAVLFSFNNNLSIEFSEMRAHRKRQKRVFGPDSFRCNNSSFPLLCLSLSLSLQGPHHFIASFRENYWIINYARTWNRAACLVNPLMEIMDLQLNALCQWYGMEELWIYHFSIWKK